MRPPLFSWRRWLAILLLVAPWALHAADLEPRTGVLLVATERLGDPNFARTVLLLLEADEHGALGLILNRPLDATLDEVMPDFPPEPALTLPLHRGGPVQLGRVTVLARTGHEGPGLRAVLPGVWAVRERDALQALLAGRPPVREARAFLGYAGWAPHQLENEIARGDWDLLETTAAEVFATPARELWQRLRHRAAGTWAAAPPATPAAAAQGAVQSPSRSTSTASTSPSTPTSTSTRMGWQQTEQSST